MTSLSKNLLFPLTRYVKRLGLSLLRLAERVLPRTLLSLLMWPAALAWAVIEAKTDRKALASWSRFPVRCRPNRLRFFFLQTIGFAHSRLVYLWPHRLTEPSWLQRCAVQASPEVEALLRSDRPIIFASLHFGPFRALPYWLRAHGVTTTALVGRPVSAESALLDRLSAPADVPVLAAVDDMRLLRRSMVAGRRLLILMDVDRGKQVAVRAGDEVFHLATGAIRLAAATGAALVPCVIVREGAWKFSIQLGAPVPSSLLGKTPDVKRAATRILEELLPVIRRFPGQCRHRLLASVDADQGQSGSRRESSSSVDAVPFLIGD